jgi:hypothetical protein
VVAVNRRERRSRGRDRGPRQYAGVAVWVSGGLVCLGVGPVDGEPVAMTAVCPTDGVSGLIAELEGAAVVARVTHGDDN